MRPAPWPMTSQQDELASIMAHAEEATAVEVTGSGGDEDAAADCC